ncbi:MAG: hypothetical protein R3Y06_03250 [Faecalibacterium sp.]
MQASEQSQQKFQPANTKLVCAILALAAVVIIGFTAALSIDLQMVRSLDPADYTETSLENFVYDASVSVEGGKIVITGWGCVAQERIDAVENDIVLYLPSTGEYFIIPTEMQVTEAANEALGDGVVDHSESGFYATVWPFQLEYDLSEYELCMSYRTNFKNALIHTGIYLEVSE